NGTIGCGLEVFGGKLYAINYNNVSNTHGLILRLDGSSWTTVYDSGGTATYIREIVAYNNTLYAFAVENQQGQMLYSTNGSDWTKQQVANRYFRGHVWEGYLWLGSTDYYANGEVGVWRFDGVNFVKTYSGTKRYVTDIKDLAGNLFAGTSNGWKDESGPCSLVMSPDGETDWQTICTFPATAVWNMAVFDGDLYVGTWDYQSTGQLYKVSLEPVTQGDCAPNPGSLGVGQTYTLQVDAHSGDEDTTQPKTDANDGQNGDNPRYRRHNVARAHNDYWYTSTYQEAGEPDPAGEQWVDYAPDFSSLGVGCYKIMAQYRGTDSRALYAAQYRIIDTRDGDVLIERVQERVGGAYVDEDLGNHFMCPDSFVRIQDPGPNSITFNRMQFTYLGSSCP
ncbi:MAG: hypothetical protein JRJ87_20015, partial [Deltaproteobacteria bacterium]|nr:hypothetical protein [Deltaproteobacteria bacterium]